MILIVDDSPANIDVLIAAIDDYDDIAVAYNGEEALEIVNDEKPQLVILDYVMPKMNGHGVLKLLKKRNPNLPVIMQTSESDKDIALQLIKEGASDYILKHLI